MKLLIDIPKNIYNLIKNHEKTENKIKIAIKNGLVIGNNIYYFSKNGYTGILYGKSSMIIVDENFNEKLHTGQHNIKTIDDLKSNIDNFPKLIEALERLCDNVE